MEKKYLLGTVPKEWSSTALDTMIIVTEDCNLRCKYCYITHKKQNKRLDFETAKKFIDYLLSDKLNTPNDIILDFIGGEPFLEIDLIDRICDYFKLAAYEKGSDWYWNYRFNFSTNGVNYSDARVQQYLKKNKGKISLSITIDGTKEKHDLQRVFPNGEGSYDSVYKNIPLYIEQCGGRTKATFASADLKYLKDSIVDLWNKGIVEISSNVVFEDVWQYGDDEILETQLMELADYALDNKLYDKYMCSFFNDDIDGYLESLALEQTSCGAGKMIALGPDGKIYPCMRYKDYSLNNKKEWVMGNVDDGVDMEKVRPFMLASRKLQLDDECLNCEVAGGCSYCQGHSYDEAETPTNFSRTKYICKMHKAQVRANDYYFSKLYNMYGVERGGTKRERKHLYFMLADDFVTYCQHENTNGYSMHMDTKTMLEGLKYARHDFFVPFFVHSRSRFTFEKIKEFDAYRIHHIVPAKFYKEAAECLNDYMLVFSENDLDMPVTGLGECLLNVNSHDIAKLAFLVEKMFAKTKKININITDVDKSFDEDEYEKQLLLILDYISRLNDESGEEYHINLFDDVAEEAASAYPIHHGCKAGDRSFVVSPDGSLYICSAHYINEPERKCGDIKNGITELKNRHLYTEKYHPLCNECDAYQCSNCVYLNENTTQEVNISPSFNCRKSHIERNVANNYIEKKHPESKLEDISYLDPINKIYCDNDKSLTIGYYTPDMR